MIRGVLLDIEGTVCPVEFVTEQLFPYARANAGSFLEANWGHPDVRRVVGGLRKQTPGVDDHPAALRDYVVSLMDAGSKSTPLKELQGLIWHSAYTRGELRPSLFPDVAPAFERWFAAGIVIAIYSSGSVTAQTDLFRCSMQGDLTRYVTAYFDTRAGSKQESASYWWIASTLRLRPDGIFFVSDAASELKAARAAGMRALLAMRPGNEPVKHEGFETIGSFDRIRFV